MTTRYRAAPLGGPARISAKHHATYEPASNRLVCPFTIRGPGMEIACGETRQLVYEIEAHIVAAHPLTEAQAREWLSPAGVNDWARHGQA